MCVEYGPLFSCLKRLNVSCAFALSLGRSWWNIDSFHSRVSFCLKSTNRCDISAWLTSKWSVSWMLIPLGIIQRLRTSCFSTFKFSQSLLNLLSERTERSCKSFNRSCLRHILLPCEGNLLGVDHVLIKTVGDILAAKQSPLMIEKDSVLLMLSGDQVEPKRTEALFMSFRASKLIEILFISSLNGV